MSNSDANQRCMICRAIGFVIAAIIVGLITWWLFSKIPAWLAILAFLGLFAFGLWAVLKYCGEPIGEHDAHGASHGAGMTAGAAAGAAGAAALAGSASDDDAAAAKAQADADAAAARAKADADAAAAKAKADADAAAAQAKADADAAAAKAKADADAAASKADDDARAAELEKARQQAELEAAKAKAEAERAAAASSTSREKAVADSVVGAGSTTPAAAVSSGTLGTKPKGLDGPRGGSADDLKRIKGVGPKMENMLNGMGYYHFDQVADWGDQEVAWVDDNLEGFKGRVTRDRWVPQARLLADGRQVSDDVLEQIKAGKDVDLTDYDNDGISEGMGEGSKPMTLDGPRGGKADDLKQIKGVGPKLEGVINDLGFWHFDQIAAWTKDEIAWVDMRLKFKGRIERDGWIEQAKLLAAGGETEFSKKVDKGDVY